MQRKQNKLDIDALVEANQGLVYSMLNRYSQVYPGHPDYDQYLSDALLALFRAALGFKPELGFQFSTYACRAIIQSIRRTYKDLQAYHARYGATYDVEMDRTQNTAMTFGIEELESTDVARELLPILTDTERCVLMLRLSDRRHNTLGDIGELVGLTKERVRQIENEAIQKLRARAVEVGLVDAARIPEEIICFLRRFGYTVEACDCSDRIYFEGRYIGSIFMQDGRLTLTVLYGPEKRPHSWSSHTWDITSSKFKPARIVEAIHRRESATCSLLEASST